MPSKKSADGAVTIRDVARRAGVAISTVSAVINRSAPASRRIVERVELAIKETGYIPHGAARTLRTGRSRVIGLIVPDITNPHFATMAKVTERACLAAGYMTFVYDTGEDTDSEMQIIRRMRSQSVSGLILVPTRSDAAHGRRLAAEIDVPSVLLDSYVDGVAFDAFTLDNMRAGDLATRHLIELGHKRIAIVAGRRGVSTAEERLAGCQQALRSFGIAARDRIVVDGNFSQSQAYETTRKVLSARRPPTGIVAVSNMMMVGVMRALRSMGLRSPDDVSIIGIDDLEWAELMNPPPTIVAQPLIEMTEVAIAALLERIDSNEEPTGRRLLFQPTLVTRESCAPPRVAA